MTKNVKLATLHHQSLRDIRNRMPLKIKTFMETAARIVDTDRTPKRQRLLLHPGQYWHRRSAQDWKVTHRLWLSSRCGRSSKRANANVKKHG
jgi:hypothetical protein